MKLLKIGLLAFFISSVLAIIFLRTDFYRDLYSKNLAKDLFMKQLLAEQNIDYVMPNTFHEKSLFDRKIINVATVDTIDLSKYRGKPVFLNYWFTSCWPCIKEFPSIEKFYEEKGDVINFFIITNERPETVKSFLLKRNYNLPFYSLVGNKFPEATSGYPTSFLFVNNRPIFRFVGMGYFDLDDFYDYVDLKLMK